MNEKLNFADDELYEELGGSQLWVDEDDEDLQACIRLHTHHIVDSKIPRRRSTICYKFLTVSSVYLKISLKHLTTSIKIKDNLSKLTYLCPLFYVIEIRASTDFNTPPGIIVFCHYLVSFATAKMCINSLRNCLHGIWSRIPNSKWEIERFTNLRVDIIPTQYPLSEKPGLPDYIRSNPHIISVEIR